MLTLSHGSVKKKFLALNFHTEARKKDFWSKTSTRKHEKRIFGPKLPHGSAKKGFLVLNFHTEARKKYFGRQMATSRRYLLTY